MKKAISKTQTSELIGSEEEWESSDEWEHLFIHGT